MAGGHPRHGRHGAAPRRPARGGRRRTRRRRRHGSVVVLVLAVVLLAVAGAVALCLPLLRVDGPHAPSTAERCTARVDGGLPIGLTPRQASNASSIVRVGALRNLPDQAMVVALATAMQESRLINVPYGDADSLGLFQQRPSQGWGTAEQVSDATYATNAFYDALLRVPGWETMSVTDAAQAVQRSAYPDRYAVWEPMARAWTAALMGRTDEPPVCTLKPAGSADRAFFDVELPAAFPSARTLADDDGRLVDIAPGTDDAAQSRQLAAWLMAHADDFGVTRLQADGSSWRRGEGAWRADGSGTAPGGGVVRVTFAGTV